MSPPGEGSSATVWAYRALVGGLLLALLLPALIRPTGDWEVVYLPAATQLRTGNDIYYAGSAYVYPPFAALFAVPFESFPRAGGRVAWAALNVLAGFVLMLGAWRLAVGRGLPGSPDSGRAGHAAFWLGGLCAAGFALDVMANRQTDLVIAAVLVTGCVLLAGGRSLAAGVAFGVATAFKCTPLLFAPYLLWRRRWLAALAVPAVAVGLNLLPDLVYPVKAGPPRLVVWKDRLLNPMGKADRDPGIWAAGVEYNHAVSGVALRWLAFERRVVDGKSLTVPKAERPSTVALKRVNLALAGGLCLVALAAVWRRADHGDALAAEVGIVFTLMLLLSPMSSKPHFCLLLVPQLALCRLGWANRDRFLIGLTALAALGGLCTGRDVVGRPAYEFLMWNGLVFWLTVSLFAGCCYARRQYGSVGAVRAEPEAKPVPAVPALARAA